MTESKRGGDVHDSGVDGGVDNGAVSAADEAKRKFREALERKNDRANANADHKDADSKPAHAHGRAGSHREFRRKSG